jgi:hypothetical protein
MEREKERERGRENKPCPMPDAPELLFTNFDLKFLN